MKQKPQNDFKFIHYLPGILILVFAFIAGCCNANAATTYGMTTDCMVYNYAYSEWQQIPNGAGIKVIMTEDMLYIYSKEPQSFIVKNVSSSYYNKSGHLQYTADGIDQDGHICNFRIVYRDDIEAPIQIYIHYSNIDYVYNIVIFETSNS